jgi:hypothetical protein
MKTAVAILLAASAIIACGPRVPPPKAPPPSTNPGSGPLPPPTSSEPLSGVRRYGGVRRPAHLLAGTLADTTVLAGTTALHEFPRKRG